MLTTNIILMCGLPASGKSTIVEKYEQLGYKILSCDRKNMSTATETATLKREIEVKQIRKQKLDKIKKL